MICFFVWWDKRKKIFLLLRDIYDDDDDDDDGFSIGVKNARVSSSFALHVLCIHIYIYIYIYIHTYTLRGMHTGTIGMSRKWLCTLCAFYACRTSRPTNQRIQGDWLRLPPPFGLLTEIGVVLPLVLTLEVSSSLLTLLVLLPSRRGGGVL